MGTSRRVLTVLSPVASHKVPLAEEVALHGFLDLNFGGARFQTEFAIQRIEFEVVVVCGPGRWARPTVTNAWEIVAPLARTARELALFGDRLREAARLARQIVEHPVDPSTTRSIGVIDDERESLRPGGWLAPGKRRRGVLPVAGVLPRDSCLSLEGAGSQFEIPSGAGAAACRQRSINTQQQGE